MQEPFFFERGGQQLFAVYYPPEGSLSGRAYLLCNAFGKEYNLCLSPLIGVARLLAKRGHAVMRFDYMGYADSQGAFEDATLATMQADIEAAMVELSRRAGVERIGLIAMRFGAALAVAVASRDDRVPELVLWEPVLKPWTYLFAELRQTVTMQTVLFREVRITRDEIVSNILAGRPSVFSGYDFNVIDEGFPLGAGLIREAKEFNITDPVPRLAARTLIVNIRKKEGPVPKPIDAFAQKLREGGGSCEVAAAVEPCAYWKYDIVFSTRAPGVYEKTLSWLAGGG
jgi:pimeloyl-ACP methyl ester carboxylesterase